jgi:hypothetical protein
MEKGIRSLLILWVNEVEFDVESFPSKVLAALEKCLDGV